MTFVTKRVETPAQFHHDALDEPIRTAGVLLADPRDDVRSGLRQALEHHGLTVVAEVRNADDAIEQALAHRPAVCLTELDLPGGWVKVVRGINAALPHTRIAVLTGSTAEDDVVRALMAGADGYMLKSTAPDRLSEGIEALIRGESVVPRTLTSALIAELRTRNVPPNWARPPLPRLLYIPRFIRHYRRRRRSNMSVTMAWRSARARMRRYTMEPPDVPVVDVADDLRPRS